MIKVWLPFLPPTSNNIYIRHPQGKGRILSREARVFKIKAMNAIQQQGKVAFVKLPQNKPYKLELIFFFKQVENKKSSTGARYKKIDISNLVKLAEDTLAEAIGIDDCHNFKVTLEKHCDPDNQGMYIIFGRIRSKKVGLTKKTYDEEHT